MNVKPHPNSTQFSITKTNKMNIDDSVKIERKFLQEQGAIQNEHGVYAYQSIDMTEIMSLDHYLREYKEWLIKNNYVILNQSK